MFTSLFLTGTLVGFLIAMPVGPIGLLCIRHSLIRGVTFGLVAGLAAACADTIYGAIAGFGLTTISGFLLDHQVWLQIMGAVFLWYLGINMFFIKPSEKETAACHAGHLRVFFTTFLLTLTNPLTILSFMGVYAGLGFGSQDEGFWHALVLSGGVFIGSALWWFILSTGSALIGKSLNLKSFHVLNWVSGSLICLFGTIAGLSAFQLLLPNLFSFLE